MTTSKSRGATRRWAAMLFAAATIGALVASPSAAAEPKGDLAKAVEKGASAEALAGIRIANWNSDLCMAVGGASPNNAAHVIQFTCNSPSPEQHWTLEWRGVDSATGRNYWWIRPDHAPHQCLAVDRGLTNPGAGLIQWPCSVNNRDHEWIVAPGSLGTILINRKSRMVAAIGSDSHAQGARVIQWPYGGNPGQQWY